MKKIRKRMSTHLTEVDKNYLEHLSGALLTSRECFTAGLAALVHGIVPFIFEKTASDKVRKMHRRQNP